MKKILVGVLLFVLGVAATIVVFSIIEDESVTLRNRIEELEKVMDEPLEGVMIAVGQKYMVMVTFENGEIIEAKGCKLEDGTCELMDLGDVEGFIITRREYVFLQMLLNQYLLEMEAEEETIEDEIEEEIEEEVIEDDNE